MKRLFQTQVSCGLCAGARLDQLQQRVSTSTAYALTPNTVELIPTRVALFLRGGPVQDPVLKHPS